MSDFFFNSSAPLIPTAGHRHQEHLHREMLSPVEQMRAKYKKRRKEAGTREDSTMAKLAMFTSAVRTTKKRVNTEDKEDKKVRDDNSNFFFNSLL